MSEGNGYDKELHKKIDKLRDPEYVRRERLKSNYTIVVLTFVAMIVGCVIIYYIKMWIRK
jgi:hypothetical protein